MKQINKLLVLSLTAFGLPFTGSSLLSQAFAGDRQVTDLSKTDDYLVPDQLRRGALICLVKENDRLLVRKVVRLTDERIRWKKLSPRTAKTTRLKRRIKRKISQTRQACKDLQHRRHPTPTPTPDPDPSQTPEPTLTASPSQSPSPSGTPQPSPTQPPGCGDGIIQAGETCECGSDQTCGTDDDSVGEYACSTFGLRGEDLRCSSDCMGLDMRFCENPGQMEDQEVLVATQESTHQSRVLLVPRTAIHRSELALIVNTNDAQSVAVANYYKAARNIPDENIIEVSFATGSTVISIDDFNTMKAQVDAVLPSNIQGLAITWTEPWRVDCMSITSALALGYDSKYCSWSPCSATASVPYYNSTTTRPYSDYSIRPAMMLGGISTEYVQALIDVGAAADASFPAGDGYFFRTTDVPRSVRYLDFSSTVSSWNRADGLVMTYIDNSAGDHPVGNYLQNTNNILFYLTGLTSVSALTTNTYVPGCVADHLTSYGGKITGSSGQMSILRFLEAGATASYGTVVEPCNYQQKFPRASVLVPKYFAGATVLEAYWKSVNWPGEGIFVGDPLARPYGTRVEFAADGRLVVETTSLKANVDYSLYGANSIAGPFSQVQSGIAVENATFATVEQAAASFIYRLAE